MKKQAVLLMLFVLTALLAACARPGATDEVAPVTVVGPVEVGVAATQPAAAPAPVDVTLDVVIQPAPTACGPEAAITFAQVQNDLALAASAPVDQALAAGDSRAADIGIAAFTIARDQIGSYLVPDCLAPARDQALAAFQARIDAYTALAAGDQSNYETLLAQSETARQAMLTALDPLFAQ